MDEPHPDSVFPVPYVVVDPIINIAHDTFAKERQLIVFVNTKRGAESQAEKIAAKQQTTLALQALAEQALHALSSPTKQCKRLAKCLEKGVAFHHAGLSSKQRDLIEDGFKNKLIKAICATPTLAAGVDLPAFRVIIRDLKRYGGPWGMTAIPVLEYEQMAGRAGRPGKDPWGEAICLAKTDNEAGEIAEKYLHGEPEELYSKLAVEPVLRTYILSLVASGFVKNKDELYAFFAKTFYAHQYGDIGKLQDILDRMIIKLEDWEFLKPTTPLQDDFVSASDLSQASDTPLQATILGRRVSELYLDPYTAHHLLKGLRRAGKKRKSAFAYVHLCASCLELRPYVKAKTADMDAIEEQLAVEDDALLHLAPSVYTDEYDTYLDTIKTTMLFAAWMDETNEDSIMEQFNVRPGELHAKLENIDWIIYAATELAKIVSFHEERGFLLQLRQRLKHGAKEELLPLLKLQDVGRVRARKLYDHQVRDVAGLKRIDPTTLAQLVGKAIAIKLKAQVGEEIDPDKVHVKPRKRKGQKNLGDWN